uniref:Uncharacterized protein n=1 Tax=Populus trichocarpa TaxID=3694 RepID=A0A2K1R440_POPTR
MISKMTFTCYQTISPLTSIASVQSVMYGEKTVQQGFLIYQWRWCSQKSYMVFSRQQTALPLGASIDQTIFKRQAIKKMLVHHEIDVCFLLTCSNFDITGASIDQTNPTHHMVLRRSRRKVKLQSQTGSIQETVEHQ